MNSRGKTVSTMRYGGNFGAAGKTGNAQELTQEAEANSVDDADPNTLMQCPYDKNHQIRACRFPFHLNKCAKNHPELASTFKTCPFNAKHVVPGHKLGDHIEKCEDKRSVTPEDDGISNKHPKFHVPIKWVPPPCEEDWEKEADENADAFVWGVTNMSLQNTSEPPVTNNLSAGVRAPRTFPWKSCEFCRRFLWTVMYPNLPNPKEKKSLPRYFGVRVQPELPRMKSFYQ